MSRQENVAQITPRGGSQVDVRAEFPMVALAMVGLGVSDSYEGVGIVYGMKLFMECRYWSIR